MSIDDSIKGELHVMCDAHACPERAERPRCYLDIYRLCSQYEAYRRLKNGDTQQMETYRS